MDSNEKKKIVHGDEIDLIELLKLLWKRKWFVLKIVLGFVVIALIIAFTTPKEYVSDCTLIPEASDGGKVGGSFDGLAAFAGIDLNKATGSGQTINTALYQTVSKSTPFLLSLMEQRYFFSELGEEVSVKDYYLLHYKSSLIGKIGSLPGRLLGALKGDNSSKTSAKDSEDGLVALSKEEEKIIKNLQNRIIVSRDEDLNLIKVRIEMQDPMVAAQMVQFTQDYITQYVTEYAISKSQQQLNSIEKQYQERKDEFEAIQEKLAIFRDKNQNVSTARAKSEEERLQSEYNLAFNIYYRIAQQREAVELQIQKDTPVFTVLEPVKVPVEKSSPRRLIIIITFGFLGGVVGIGITLVKLFL